MRLIFAIAATATASVAISCSGDDSSRSPSSDCTRIDSAECFAADFYSWYSRPADSGGAGMTMEVAIRKRPSAFASPLLTALNIDVNAQAASSEGVVGLNGDGFINSQDPCERYTTGRGVPAGERIRVPVYSVCNGAQSDSARLYAEVARTDSGFAFTNFIYNETSDLLGALARLRQDRNDNVIVRGACPFECCGYGKWTFVEPATLLRYAPNGDSVGVIPAGEQASVDSGFVWLNPTGLAIVTSDSLRLETPQRPPVRKGDTLYLLDYHGEGYRSVRWHDTVTWSMEEQWDSTGSQGARLVREPVASWWVHVTRPRQSGWVHMTPAVSVRGADRCGR